MKKIIVNNISPLKNWTSMKYNMLHLCDAQSKIKFKVKDNFQFTHSVKT